MPFFDYQGERLVLDNFFEKWQEGCEIRPDGIPSKMVAYWNKKNGLSIDSMPGLNLADDLSTALVPPFKLERIARSEQVNGQAAESSSRGAKVGSESPAMSSPYLVVYLASSFMLGVVATYGFQAAYHLAPW